MDWGQAHKALERAVDTAAVAAFAAAAAFAAGALAFDGGAAPLAWAVPAFLLAFAALRSVPPEERRYALPKFALVELEPTESGARSDDELLLNDVLPAAEPGARVVRLFGPGQAAAAAGPPGSAPGDASEALSEALAALRRSLR